MLGVRRLRGFASIDCRLQGRHRRVRRRPRGRRTRGSARPKRCDESTAQRLLRRASVRAHAAAGAAAYSAAILALVAIPFGHVLLQRGPVVARRERRRRPARRRDRARRPRADLSGGRRPAAAPGHGDAWPDARRRSRPRARHARRRRAHCAAGARGGQGARCLLFSIGYSRAIQPVLRYPKNLALPAELAGRHASAGRRAARAQAERRRHRRPGEARRRVRRAATLRAIGHAALAGRTRGLAADGARRRPRSRPRPHAAQARVAQLLSAPIALTRRGRSRPASGPCGGSRRCSRRPPTAT